MKFQVVVTLAIPLLLAACTEDEVDMILGDDGSSDSSGDVDPTSGSTSTGVLSLSQGSDPGTSTDTTDPTDTETSTDTDDPPSGSVAGDVNGDGFIDLVMYIAYDDVDFIGKAYVLYGPDYGATLDDADEVIFGPATATNTAAVCDVDGDGRSEIVIGGDYPSTDTPEAIYIYSDGTTTTVTTEQGFFGLHCTDLDDDGFDDLILNGYGNPAVDASVQIVAGSGIELGTEGPGDTVPIGEPTDNTATGVALGDFDGDGSVNLFVGTPSADGLDGAFEAGKVTVWDFSNGIAAASSAPPMAEIEGVVDGDFFGSSVEVCDCDDDGDDDLLVIEDNVVEAWSDGNGGTADSPHGTATIAGQVNSRDCNAAFDGIVTHDGVVTSFVVMDFDAQTSEVLGESDELLVLELGGTDDELFGIASGGDVTVCVPVADPACEAVTSLPGDFYTVAEYSHVPSVP